MWPPHTFIVRRNRTRDGVNEGHEVDLMPVGTAGTTLELECFEEVQEQAFECAHLGSEPLGLLGQSIEVKRSTPDGATDELFKALDTRESGTNRERRFKPELLDW